MLSAGFAGFHEEFVQPLWLVFQVLTVAEAINRQTHGFAQRPRFHFNGMLHTVRIPESHSTTLQVGSIQYSLFIRLRYSAWRISCFLLLGACL